MELEEFKKQYIRNELQITKDYGRMLALIDFGNVNYWFEQDRQDADNKALGDDEKLKINLVGLRDFARLFSYDLRFYYGSDVFKEGSVRFISAVKDIYGRNRVFSKQIQYIRDHSSRYLNAISMLRFQSTQFVSWIPTIHLSCFQVTQTLSHYLGI